ncbi:hypothetical protein ACIBQX_35600 [Nonomuraea sp. NPDC049714]|uniref:hypothetical protein n=1 Tax=Nonomuraea sp. NPDC049714 TaxID=3364357 RepID=UPI00379B01FF
MIFWVTGILDNQLGDLFAGESHPGVSAELPFKHGYPVTRGENLPVPIIMPYLFSLLVAGHRAP